MRLDGERRILIVGKTGSGKSFLARHLLKQMEAAGYRIVIIDPKVDWQGSKKKGTWQDYGKPPGTVDHPVLITDFKFHPEWRVMIIHPVVWSDHLGAFLKDTLYEGDTVDYFDEGTQLVNANFVPVDFATVVSQGRSKGTALWYGTQRSVGIPVLIKEQSNIRILMRVDGQDDRKVMGPYMNAEDCPELVTTKLPERYFWVYDDEVGYTLLYAPLQLDKPHGEKTSRSNNQKRPA